MFSSKVHEANLKMEEPSKLCQFILTKFIHQYGGIGGIGGGGWGKDNITFLGISYYIYRLVLKYTRVKLHILNYCF